MELENVSKYLSIYPTKSGVHHVLYSGQPCLFVAETEEGFRWYVNPVFAQLVYGADHWTDIPQGTTEETLESAIAAGISILHELSCFKEYDADFEHEHSPTVAELTHNELQYNRAMRYANDDRMVVGDDPLYLVDLDESVEEIEEEIISEASWHDQLKATHEKATIGGKTGYRPHVVHRDSGKTSYLGGGLYKDKDHAEEAAKHYITSMDNKANLTKGFDFAIADRKKYDADRGRLVEGLELRDVFVDTEQLLEEKGTADRETSMDVSPELADKRTNRGEPGKAIKGRAHPSKKIDSVLDKE